MTFPDNRLIVFVILIVACFWTSNAFSRQNIVIGEFSIGYDFTEREYDDSDNLTADEAAILTGNSADFNNDTDEGDTRRWFLIPRVRFSSTGISDFMEFTYAPTLYYDELESDSNTGHDLNLLAEKNLTRSWSFQISDNYYYGDDAVEDTALSEAEIIPGSDEPDEEQTVGAEQTDGTGQSLREQNDRREYWRNTFNLGTDYTYSQDSVVGLGYSFGVLRNIDDDEGGYQDYDRHEGTGRLSYRLNRFWRLETEGAYVRGYYEPTEITYLQPETNTDETEAESGEQTVYSQSEEEVNDDLEEYHFVLRTDYDWQTRDRLFGLYSYSATDYEAELREDAAIHGITMGWNHDFSRALHITFSGGPTFVTYDERSTDSGYNAYAGMIWDFQHASLTANTSYGYEFDNFDGDRTGLRKAWRSGLNYAQDLSPQLSLLLGANYVRSDNEEPLATTVLLTSSDETTEDEVIEYTEESYDTGLTLSYTFLRWYTVSAYYRYADYRSENDLDYDEHRMGITLTASKELFRW